MPVLAIIRRATGFAPAIVLAIAMCFGGSSAACGQQANSDGIDQMLTRAGLSRVEKTWIVADEFFVHERLLDAAKIERRLQDSQKRCDSAIKELDQARAQLISAEDAYQRVDKVLKVAPAGPLKISLERDHREQALLVARLKKDVPPEDLVGGTAPLKGLLAEQTALLAELAGTTAIARRSADRVLARYAEISADETLANCFAGEYKLGPAKRWNAELKQLSALENATRTATLPFYREGKHVRCGLIVDDETPAVFSWNPDIEETVIPMSLAMTIGNVESLEVATKSLTIAGTRMTVRGMTLGSIRAGRSLRKDVRVWVLPPENEALGARLGYELIRDLRLSLNLERLSIECGKSTP